MYHPTTEDPAGVWQAYVGSGSDSQDMKARLSGAPEHLKQRIIIHVKTVLAIKKQRQKSRK